MLIDSNLIIYSALPGYDELRRFIVENSPTASVVSKIEVLGFRFQDVRIKNEFEALFSQMVLHPVTTEIVDRAILLRQSRKMKLGDSLIAATALEHSRILLTHNVSDFRGIPNLNVLDPLAST